MERVRKGLFAERDIDPLHGPLLKKVFAFSLPLICTNLLQVFYNAADMIVVALSNAEGAVGSIGVTGPLVNLLLNIFTGLAIGTTVVVARDLGRGDDAAVGTAVHTSVAVAFYAGLITLGIGIVFRRSVLTAMGETGRVLELSSLYTGIYFAGAPFQALTNNFAAIFRAKGDTRTPLYVLSGTGLLNVGLNLFFVLALGMDVDGVAYATVISQAVSAAVLGVMLGRQEGAVRFSFKKLHIDRDTLGEIVREGLPASLQGILFSISNMLIQSSVLGINNALCPGGSAVIDGNAAANSIEGFIYQTQSAVSQAAVTFTSRHYGARMYRRIDKVIKSCYLATAIVTVCFSAVLLLLNGPLIRIYVSDPLAVKTGTDRMVLFMLTYYFLAFMDCGSNILRGLGRSMTSALVTLSGACLFRILWIAFVFPLDRTMLMLYTSYPVSWAITALCHFLFITRERRKLLLLPDIVEEAA